MKNKQILENALAIIADASKTPIEDLKSVFQTYPRYRTFYQKKRSGGKREINAPVGKTEIVQRNLYHNFLSKIATGGNISPYCCGGIPKKSVHDGIKAHVFKLPDFIVDIDLKDAFHCVDRVSLEKAILDLLHEEIFFYKLRYHAFLASKKNREYLLSRNGGDEDAVLDKIASAQKKLLDADMLFAKRYGKMSSYGINEYLLLFNNRRIIFPNKLNKEWRSLIRNADRVSDVYQVCGAMAFVLAKILTHKGKLPQGSHTSPILMALVLSHTQLLRYLGGLLGGFKEAQSFPSAYTRTSVYVDNIALSVYSESSKQELSEKLRKVIETIEQKTIWKINMKKVHVYDPLIENPLILGQRLVKNRKTRQELKQMVWEKIKGARRCLKAWEPWHYLKPTIPKKLQRKIRSVLHTASIDAASRMISDKVLHQKARSYIGYVFDVYRSILHVPSQLQKPLEKYCENVDPELLMKFYRQTTA